MISALVLVCFLPGSCQKDTVYRDHASGLIYRIQYDGVVQSRLYVPRPVNDRCVEVPVVNGIYPTVTEVSSDGILVERQFNYTMGIKYDGPIMFISYQKKPAGVKEEKGTYLGGYYYRTGPVMDYTNYEPAVNEVARPPEIKPVEPVVPIPMPSAPRKTVPTKTDPVMTKPSEITGTKKVPSYIPER